MKKLNRVVVGLVLAGAVLTVPQSVLATPTASGLAADWSDLGSFWSWVFGLWVKAGPCADPSGQPCSPAFSGSLLDEGPADDSVSTKEGPCADPAGQPCSPFPGGGPAQAAPGTQPAGIAED